MSIDQDAATKRTGKRHRVNVALGPTGLRIGKDTFHSLDALCTAVLEQINSRRQSDSVAIANAMQHQPTELSRAILDFAVRIATEHDHTAKTAHSVRRAAGLSAIVSRQGVIGFDAGARMPSTRNQGIVAQWRPNPLAVAANIERPEFAPWIPTMAVHAPARPVRRSITGRTVDLDGEYFILSRYHQTFGSPEVLSAKDWAMPDDVLMAAIGENEGSSVDCGLWQRLCHDVYKGLITQAEGKVFAGEYLTQAMYPTHVLFSDEAAVDRFVAWVEGRAPDTSHTRSLPVIRGYTVRDPHKTASDIINYLGPYQSAFDDLEQLHHEMTGPLTNLMSEAARGYPSRLAHADSKSELALVLRADKETLRLLADAIEEGLRSNQRGNAAVGKSQVRMAYGVVALLKGESRFVKPSQAFPTAHSLQLSIRQPSAVNTDHLEADGALYALNKAHKTHGKADDASDDTVVRVWADIRDLFENAGEQLDPGAGWRRAFHETVELAGKTWGVDNPRKIVNDTVNQVESKGLIKTLSAYFS